MTEWLSQVSIFSFYYFFVHPLPTMGLPQRSIIHDFKQEHLTSCQQANKFKAIKGSGLRRIQKVYHLVCPHEMRIIIECCHRCMAFLPFCLYYSFSSLFKPNNQRGNKYTVFLQMCSGVPTSNIREIWSIKMSKPWFSRLPTYSNSFPPMSQPAMGKVM